MKQLLTILAGVGLLAAISATAMAESVTFRFDPDALIQKAPGSAGTSDTVGQNKKTQPNARRTHQPWATNVYETFYNPGYVEPQPESYNSYMNWRDGLGDDEGISAFNIWLLDNPNARSWGETIVWNPDGAAPTGTADAAGKWDVEVIPNPWGAGWLVQWSTDNPADYINISSTIGEFSFSGTAYHDNNENGYDATDPEVKVGDSARVWFGAVNWTEPDGGTGWTQEWSVHFDDQGWGTRTENNGGGWSAGLVDSEGYGSGYEGVIDFSPAGEGGGSIIPEPGAVMALVGMGLMLGLSILYRRRRNGS